MSKKNAPRLDELIWMYAIAIVRNSKQNQLYYTVNREEDDTDII